MFLWPRYEKEKEFNDTLRTGARRFKKKTTTKQSQIKTTKSSASDKSTKQDTPRLQTVVKTFHLDPSKC